MFYCVKISSVLYFFVKFNIFETYLTYIPIFLPGCTPNLDKEEVITTLQTNDIKVMMFLEIQDVFMLIFYLYIIIILPKNT